MTNEQMIDALLAANTALAEKLGHKPYIEFTLILDDRKWRVGSAYIYPGMSKWVDGPFSDSIEGAFNGVMKVIAKMPDPAQRNLQEFQAKVADAIDFGNKQGIEAQWLNPLVETARALASNALTHEAAE